MATLAEIFAANPWMNSSIGPQYNRNDSRFSQWDEYARRGYGREGTTEGAQADAAPWLYDANGQAYIRKQVSTPDGRMAYQNFDPFSGAPISEPDVVLGAANMAEEFGGPPGGAASGKTVPWSVVASGADLGGNGTDRYTAQGVRESDFMDSGLALMLAAAGGFAGAGAAGYGGAAESLGTSAATNAATAAGGGASGAENFLFPG